MEFQAICVSDPSLSQCNKLFVGFYNIYGYAISTSYILVRAPLNSSHALISLPCAMHVFQFRSVHSLIENLIISVI